MYKKISIALILVLCLVMNSAVAFAAAPNDMKVSEKEVVTEENSARATFIGTFDSNGVCTITGVPNEGGYQILFLQNVPEKHINCTITGNSNLHYELEFLYSGYELFGGVYTSNQILGNGSTTDTITLRKTGGYYVSITPYNGSLNAQKITLVFRSW